MVLALALPAAASEDPPPGGLQPSGRDEFTYVPPPAQYLERGTALIDFTDRYPQDEQLNGGPPQDVRDAVRAALDIWETQIRGYPGQEIVVDVYWRTLSSLASAGANGAFISDDFPDPDAYYVAPLAEAIAESDIFGTPDINIFINKDVNWYLGTSGSPEAGEYDLVSVVLHEIGHGLGFDGGMTYDDGAGDPECRGVAGEGCWSGNYYSIYGSFTESPVGRDLVDEATYPNPSEALGDALTSDAVFWRSTSLRATYANRGQFPKIYAPATWDRGSSYSHLDEAAFPAGGPDSLMTPRIGSAEVNHDPGLVMLCMLEEMGWDTVAACVRHCRDGVDNDGDGLTDEDDPGCGPSGTGNMEDPQCDDGIDNDGDGRVDYPDDPNCLDGGDNLEDADNGCNAIGSGAGATVAIPVTLLLALRRRAPSKPGTAR